jgi:mannose-1-phosphate guanylyltransferase
MGIFAASGLRMKAFLLAGGLGTRLRPLTDNTPKCLLPVQGIPILQIWFDICRQYGIEEILINVHAHGGAVRKFIQENNDRLRVRLFEETALLGSAGTVLANQKWVNKERSFWVFYADVLTTANLNQMLAFHDTRGQIATIGVYEVADPSRCGIVQVDDNGVVRDFVEKPQVPVGNLAFSGLMLATPALLNVIPDTSPVDLGFHVLPQIVGRMAAYRIPDFLMDIGTLETYRAAQTTWPGLSQSQEQGSIRA